MSAEQISPELVLVDPELAARARADLPWNPTSYTPAAPRAASMPPPEPARPRRAITVRVPVGAAIWLLGGTTILLTLALGAVPSGERPQLLPATAATASVQPAQPPVASPPATGPSPVATVPAPATSAPAPTAAVPQRPEAAPTPAFWPGRVIRWAPHAGASYYRVVFTRGGRPFYEAWPRENRLTLPARLHFRPGRYTWVVEPGSGNRSAKQLGPAIARSTFTVGG